MQTQEIDYSRKWFVLAAVGMGVFLGTIDGSIVNIALPTLERTFGTEFATVQWVTLAYLLTVTTLMLSMGRLGDMIGKKPVYATGFVVFTLGSLMCGIAPSIYFLIAFRVLQAIGAAMMTLGMAIIAEAFPPQERGKALGISGSLVSIGIITGPVVGGLILSAVSWRWIFYVNLPIGILGTWMVLRFVPEPRQKTEERFDFLGAAAMFVTLCALLLGLSIGQNTGFATSLPMALFGVSLASLIAFILIEIKSPFPMIDLRLFRNRLFDVNLITGVLSFITIAGPLLLMPFYLENVMGYPPRTVGLFMTIVPIMMGVTAPLAGSLSDRVGTRPVTVAGLAILTGGYAALTTLGTDTTPLGYILRFMPIGIGMGVFQSPNNSAILGSVPRERLGIASGLLASSRGLGQTTGIAVLGAFWAGRVTHYLGSLPEGGATSAPGVVQVEALSDVFLVAATLVTLGLILATWGLLLERRQRATTQSASQI